MIVTGVGRWQRAQVEQAICRDLPGQCFGLLQRPLQPGLGQVGGGRISLDPVDPHGEHGALVLAEERWLGDIAAYRQ
ncbi:hypothetical protein D3C71_2178240 [compost metagenome]